METNCMTPATQEPAKHKSSNLGKIGPVSVSLILHVALMLVIGGAVIIEQVIPKSNFQPAIIGENFDQPVNPDTPLDEEMQDPSSSQGPELPSDTVSVPEAMATENSIDAIAVDSPVSSTMWTITAGSGTPGISAGAPGGGGTPGGTGKGVGKKVTFFGLQSEAERIGFYLDFSGSMEGPNRNRLIKEMTKTLQDLPDGTEVMIVLWAGPAWTLGEDSKEVEGRWNKKNSMEWDPRGSFKKPQYYVLNASTRAEILSDLNKVKQLPGGTDWGSPFLLASKASPSPDLVFIMTDGQHKTGDATDPKKNLNRFEDSIKKYTNLGNPEKPTKINIVALPSDEVNYAALKSLAEKYKGEITKVK
jgi:hypothetical protein